MGVHLSEEVKEAKNKLFKIIQTARPNIKDNSAQQYVNALSKICKNFHNGEVCSPEDTIKLLKDYPATIEFIESQKQITTKKNLLTAILVFLGYYKTKYAKQIKLYNDELTSLNGKYTNFLKKQEKTSTQEKNWISYDELLNVQKKIKDAIDEGKIYEKDKPTTHDRKILQQYILLSIHLIYPLRNDLANLVITLQKDYKDDAEGNFLIVGDDKTKAEKGMKKVKYTIVLNSYKNSKFLGKQTLPISNVELIKAIDFWLKISSSGYLIVNSRGEPANPSVITGLFNRLFKEHLPEDKKNKNISSSLIRHIIISHESEGQDTILERESKAAKYMHSSEVNDLYRKVSNKKEKK